MSKKHFHRRDYLRAAELVYIALENGLNTFSCHALGKAKAERINEAGVHGVYFYNDAERVYWNTIMNECGTVEGKFRAPTGCGLGYLNRWVKFDRKIANVRAMCLLFAAEFVRTEGEPK